MDNEDRVWLKTPEQKIDSLIADEAKMINILDGIASDIRQLQAKTKFRLALLNQLKDNKS
jgi:hypothetical protein